LFKVSVVIPAYNQAQFLGEAIQSVLDQTYPNFELLVVNDASPDNTAEVVGQFSDPRMRYIAHEENRGLPAARNSGMRAAEGELIALLDGDDFFHPDKLAAHVDFYKQHPRTGATYNNRFDLNYSAKTIRNLNRPPKFVELYDFVLGFPFAPSDMVLRREWAHKINFFNEMHRSGAEDIDFPCRLALEGCEFSRVDKALNYRRYVSGRMWRNIHQRIDDALLALESIFSDPRCPPEVKEIQHVAIKNHYQVLTYPAFAQGETELGQELLREAVRLMPSIIQGNPCPYVEMLAHMSAADENIDHAAVLEKIFLQIPKKYALLSKQFGWAIGRGLLIKAISSIIWGRNEDGKSYFAQAIEKQAALDRTYLNKIAHQLLDYASEFGYPQSDQILEDLIPNIERIGGRSGNRYLRGHYSLNKAFKLSRHGDYSNARKVMGQAVFHQPVYLFNRGVISLLIRSGTNKNDSLNSIVLDQPHG
jgi:glycosyltransferase involved in cell wall biosynthesis